MLLLLQGCTPTCRQTCSDLLACDELDASTVSLDECERDCKVQEDAYTRAKKDDDDPAPLESFDQFRACVRGATCEELAAGACYDPDLFPF